MNLYIGNLSYLTTENQLQAIFSDFGPVKAVKIVQDLYTKRSKGFGFIEMSTRQGGERAIQKLNHTSINQQPITVTEAKGNIGAGSNRY